MDNFKTIDCTDLEVIGKGVTATVYKLDDTKIIKAYKKQISLDFIENERNETVQAVECGVKTPECYETVKTEEWYGNVYQNMTGGTLTEKLLSADENEIMKWISEYAMLARGLHAKKSPPAWKNYKKLYGQQIELSKDLLTDELYNRICKIFDSVPEADNILHGDLSSGNIMLEQDQLYFIDLATVGKGHPVFDLIVPYMVTVIWPLFTKMANDMSPEEREKRKDWFAYLNKYSQKSILIQFGEKAWKLFVKVYFQLQSLDDEFIPRFTALIRNYSMAKYCLCGFFKNIYSAELINEMINYYGGNLLKCEDTDMELLKDDRWNF